ncbi:hypothetical protein [Aureispira sp. CCB-E]|uniref:hypothetical protein n=1 Tax=Aureispira sp. CCB-E TaxID=3051121 RepID=UPI002868B31C|nr:hypothetical protein [Aureispira sp. CCB-E]WMX12301.1 hypothetical protein QP953_15845 [Aureispira sp. CCB-E]
MEVDAILKENLISWLGNNQGKDGKICVYWKMFQVRSMSSQPVKSTPCIGYNLNTDSLDDSIEMLIQSLEVLTHVRFVCVRFMRETNDNSYLTHHIVNPFWNKEISLNANPSINGIGATTNVIGMNGQYLEAINTIHQQKEEITASKFDAKFAALETNLKHQNEIKELKDEISGLKSAKSNFIGEVFNELKEPIAGLFAAFATKIVASVNEPSIEPQKQEPQQEASSSNRQFDPIINNIKNYPHYAALLAEIAVLAKLDPHVLHEHRKAINQAAAMAQQNAQANGNT